jgi:hypothetical protein
MNLLKYFDLNQRARHASNAKRTGMPPKTGRIVWPMWDFTQPSQVLAAAWLAFTHQEAGSISMAEQLLMYCGVLGGVYFSGMIRGQDFRPTLLLAAVMALMIIPIAFEKLSINPRAPLIVRFGLFVQNGVFWDVLLQAIGNTRP